MNYKDWKEWWESYLRDYISSDKQHDDEYDAYYYLYSYPKKYNWTIEKSDLKLSMKDKLENTYNNDNTYKQALQRLMDEIDGALKVGDRDWFERASKEYKALKMECLNIQR